MKAAREHMDMHAAYREVGSYRAAADICGTTPKTIRRSVDASCRAKTGGGGSPGEVTHNYDGVVGLVAASIERTRGRITAKRILPVAVAAGYRGSARNFWRLLADAKAAWRKENHRGRRPGVWAPGDVVAFDWGEIGPLFVFCAVAGWSRFRFVSFADNLGAKATMAALAECFETFGGVPRVALTDRMGCLKGGTVAGLVIPTPAYVRFATHYGFRPDFCEGADPESKGIVENLVGYVKSDLMIPEQLSVADLAGANAKARAWCVEVNAQIHSETAAVPAQRLIAEREVRGPLPSLRAQIGKVVIRKVDRLSCVWFGSARYSVPNANVGAAVELRVRDGVITVVADGEIVAEHLVVAAGETSIRDEHYGGPRPTPARAVRPKSPAETAFCGLGPAAEAFIRGAAAQGMTGLAEPVRVSV